MNEEKGEKKEIPDEIKEEIKDVLDLFDGEIQGKIPSNKLKLAMKALGLEPTDDEVNNILKELDKNNEGFITSDNFTKKMSEKMLEINQTEEMKKAFKLVVDEETQKITFKSLQKAVRDINKDMKDDEILQLIQEADKDKDGAIGEDDFLKVLVKNNIV